MLNQSTFDADLEYAARMVRAGYATVEQAARTCGIPIAMLQEHLARTAPSTPAKSPQTPKLPERH